MLCQCQRVCELHDLLPGKRAAWPRPAEAGEAHPHAGACSHRLDCCWKIYCRAQLWSTVNYATMKRRRRYVLLINSGMEIALRRAVHLIVQHIALHKCLGCRDVWQSTLYVCVYGKIEPLALYADTAAAALVLGFSAIRGLRKGRRWGLYRRPPAQRKRVERDQGTLSCLSLSELNHGFANLCGV